MWSTGKQSTNKIYKCKGAVKDARTKHLRSFKLQSLRRKHVESPINLEVDHGPVIDPYFLFAQLECVVS